MSDIISINQLEVRAHLGVTAAERRRRQKVHISIELRVRSVTSAALTDDLATTVDYFAVCERIKALAAERPRKLIETLAEEIARMILTQFTPVREVTVEVEKYILPDTRSVSIRIKRPLTTKTSKKRLRVGRSDTPPPVSGEEP